MEEKTTKSRVNKKDKLIKNYLTSNEIIELVKILIEFENSYEREIVKIGMLCQLLINKEEFNKNETTTYDDCNDYYDWYVSQNVIDFNKDITNYETIDRLVNEELGVNKTVKKFLDELNLKIDEYSKSIDLAQQENLINQLKEVINKNETSSI